MAEKPASVATRARSIVRRAEKATLATLIGDAGDPYTSLVMVACDQSGAPLMLLSDLAQHTANFARDPRAALAFDATADHENPLSGPRLSLLGRIEAAHDEALIARYLRRHDDAPDYLALGDFRLWRLAVERAHIVAGFGAIHWLEGGSLTVAASPALAAAEPDIIAHMNADHADALALYAGVRDGARDGAIGDWTMTGIDPEGVDIAGPAGRVRCDFDAPIDGPAAARSALAAMAREAWAGAAG